MLFEMEHIDIYYDAVDWQEVLKQKEKDATELRRRIDELERLVQKRDDRVKVLKKELCSSERRFENLQEEYIRNRKRLQWLERKKKRGMRREGKELR